MEFLPEIIAAIVPVLAGAGVFVRWYLTRRDQKESNESVIQAEIRKARHIQSELRTLRLATGAERALILRINNSGAVARIARGLKSTVVFESLADDETPIAPNWREQITDAFYVRMVSELLQKESLTLNVETDVKGILRNVYDVSRVRMSHLNILGELEGELFYLSLPFEQLHVLTPEDEESIRSSVSRLRVLLGVE